METDAVVRREAPAARGDTLERSRSTPVTPSRPNSTPRRFGPSRRSVVPLWVMMVPRLS
jgi:hypothetical protein